MNKYLKLALCLMVSFVTAPIMSVSLNEDYMVCNCYTILVMLLLNSFDKED